MNYFWYDHLPRPNIEEPRLEGFKEIVELFGAMRITAAYDFGSEANGLVFVHAGNQQGNTVSDWEGMANNESQRYVVFISSVGVTPPFTSDEIYCVSGSFASIAKEITSEKVDKFKKSLAEGDPEWNIFSPHKWPENLVALYLLDIARVKLDDPNIGSDIFNKIVANAKDEYMERMNNRDFPDDASERIKAVRELFVRVVSQ